MPPIFYACSSSLEILEILLEDKRVNPYITKNKNVNNIPVISCIL